MDNRYFKLLFLVVAYSGQVSCQTITKLQQTVESVQMVEGLKGAIFIGYDNKSPVFMKTLNQSENKFEFYLLDEKKFQLSNFSKQFKLPIMKSDWAGGFLRIEKYYNDFWVYTIGYASDDYTLYYQDIWLQYKGSDYKLDSIYNSDKKIYLSISNDEKLIVNTLNPLSDYYNLNQDNQFSIFSLRNIINSGEIIKEIIPCQFCSDVYMIDQKIIYTKSDQRDDFDGGYAWTDIYGSPLDHLVKNKIAGFSDIISLSPDGKYILAKRIFDLPNGPTAIIDVQEKKYQLLLGRDYSKAQSFYSYDEGKFAFCFGNRIVYLDFPVKFPFDALRKGNPEIPNFSNKEFYKKFMHPPFD